MILEQDYKVYNHFKTKFDEKLESFGYGKMVDEMEGLRKANEAVKKRCEFSAADNNIIKGDNRWWGQANLVAYLVNICRICSASTSAILCQGRGRGG